MNCARFKQVFPKLDCFVFEKQASTCTWLKQAVRAQTLAKPTLCYTHQQTQGYGQRGRQWTHLPGALALSYAVPLTFDLSQHLYLNAWLAMTLAETLQSLYPDAALTVKWPNDIYLDDDKLGGLLVEVERQHQLQSQPQTWLIIGVGLNVLPGEFDPQLMHTTFKKMAWLDHQPHWPVIQSWLLGVNQGLQFIENQHLVFRPSHWQRLDYFAPNEDVIVYDNGTSYQASYGGISQQGQLILRVNQQPITHHNGQVSIRPLSRTRAL